MQIYNIKYDSTYRVIDLSLSTTVLDMKKHGVPLFASPQHSSQLKKLIEIHWLHYNNNVPLLNANITVRLVKFSSLPVFRLTACLL